MKKTLTTIFLILMILTVAGVALSPNLVRADGCNILTGLEIRECVIVVASNISEVVLTIVSWFTSMCGVALNMSIILTLNIKALYTATPAIEQVWIIIRNISSIFIIFGLIYTSIETILNIGKTGVGTMVKNIVIAGLLINFSLFFVKIMIDGSNLVSLQFYRAITPQSQNVDITKADIGTILGASFKSGGISDVFMAGLKIPKIYDQKQGVLKATNAGVMIIIHTYLGSILMIIAGLTFLAAAMAFTARIAILLIMMAFSPLYFVGIIFPRVASETKKYTGIFFGQLIFMPVYLILLYAAMKFIGEGGFFTSLNNSPATTGNLLLADAGLIFQYALALIMINIPLIAAIQTGAMAPKWVGDIKGMAQKWTGKVSGAVGRNTLGRAGGRVGGAFDSMAASAQGNAVGRGASTVLRTLGISQAVRGGISSVEKGKYGSSQNLEERNKEDKDRARVISGVNRTKTQMAAIGTYMNAHKSGTPPTTAEVDAFRKQVGGMDVKELQKLDIKTLTDPKFASHIPASKFEALMKSDELTPQQQSELKAARETGFREIASGVNGGDYLVNTHLKGKPQDIAKLPSDVITQRDVAKHFDPAVLRKMVDENVSKVDRDAIRSIIESYMAPVPGSTIDKAQKYLQTNYVF